MSKPISQPEHTQARSAKWRGNHRPGLCMRFNCPARDRHCGDCIRFGMDPRTDEQRRKDGE